MRPALAVRLLRRGARAAARGHCRCKHVSASSSLADAFVRRPTGESPDASTAARALCLFGRAELYELEGFGRLYDKIERRCTVLSASIGSGEHCGRVVAALDELSNELCAGADLAECMRLVHADARWRRAAEEAMIRYTQLVESLNTRGDLYNALKADLDSAHSRMCAVERRVGQLLLADFESSGVHLRQWARGEFVELSECAFVHGAHFTRGCDAPADVPQALRSVLGRATLHDSLAWHPHAAARRAGHTLYYAFDRRQSEHLHSMVSARRRLSQLCGYAHYADRALQHCFIDTGHGAGDFVHSLMRTLRPAVDEDVKRLRADKADSDCGSGSGSGAALHMADVPHAINAAKRRAAADALGIQSGSGSRPVYAGDTRFPLGPVMQAIGGLCTRLYGVELRPATGGHRELLWAGDVVKVSAYDGGRLLGHIYCDFARRPDKFGGDCHFTITCGKRLADGDYQTPVVVLSLGLFDQTAAEHHGGSLHGEQVENLVHEFGHAMHSMLGRTRLQHVAGTRCSTDLAEVPSNVMEHIFFQPSVMAALLHGGDRRDQTAAFLAGRGACASLELQQQAVNAALDLHLHTAESDDQLQHTAVAEKYAELCERYLPGIEHPPPLAKGDCASPPPPLPLHRFAHVVPYGGKYHTYLVAEAAASLVHQRLFGQGERSVNREAGDKWRWFQSRGGELPMGELLRRITGTRPHCGHLIDALCKQCYT